MSQLSNACLIAGLAIAGGAAAQTPPSDDPYAWLEDVQGEKSLDWVKARNAKAEAEIAGTPEFKRLDLGLGYGWKSGAVQYRVTVNLENATDELLFGDNNQNDRYGNPGMIQTEPMPDGTRVAFSAGYGNDNKPSPRRRWPNASPSISIRTSCGSTRSTPASHGIWKASPAVRSSTTTSTSTGCANTSRATTCATCTGSARRRPAR